MNKVFLIFLVVLIVLLLSVFDHNAGNGSKKFSTKHLKQSRISPPTKPVPPQQSKPNPPPKPNPPAP